ncbi:MAG: ABC transporter permease [Pseudomonadota bacterium]
MSLFAFLGAVELGLIYGLVALGVFLTFRILDFPDLTVDGGFAMGGAVAGVIIVAGVFGAASPWLALLAAFAAGGAAGLVTAILAVRFKILHLLASILTMIAAYSINIRIMGRPNLALLGEDTVVSETAPAFEALGLGADWGRVLLAALFAAGAAALLIRLLASDFGLAMRAAGQNPRFLAAQGGAPGLYVAIGLTLSNGIVAVGGALFAQFNGFADVSAGVGTIVVGLAAVILGETLFGRRAIWMAALACVLGSVLYRIAMAVALNVDALGLRPSDLNLVTAALVALALIAPQLKRRAA